MSNPVFDRIDKGISQGGYATFGGRQQPQHGPPQGTRYGQAPGYGQQGPPPQMSSEQLGQMYASPSAGPVAMGRVTFDDVIMKFLGLFGLVLAGAAITGLLLPRSTTTALMLPAILITLGLGLVIAFKKTISVPLIVAFAALEGVLVGSVSSIYANAFGPNVVSTAVIATLCVFAAMLFGWKSGIVKVTSKSRRIFTMAIGGYLLFALANFVAAWAFGANSGWGFFGFGSGMSILVSVFAVGLASYSLAMDFDSIDRAVSAQMPEKYSWLLAHGLIVTVVWLYLELLRLIAQLTGRD